MKVCSWTMNSIITIKLIKLHFIFFYLTPVIYLGNGYLCYKRNVSSLYSTPYTKYNGQYTRCIHCTLLRKYKEDFDKLGLPESATADQIKRKIILKFWKGSECFVFNFIFKLKLWADTNYEVLPTLLPPRLSFYPRFFFLYSVSHSCMEKAWWSGGSITDRNPIFDVATGKTA